MKTSPTIETQRGSALIFGLLFLIIMTILGVTGMQGTILQEHMAGNLRDHNLAFQGAEEVLRIIEDKAKLKVTSGVTGSLSLPMEDWVKARMQQDCSADSLRKSSDFGSLWSAESTTQHEYAITPIPKNSPCIPSESLGRGMGGAEHFWIMTKAHGPSGASEVDLQVVYMMR
ncbi:MAG TPA: PilX N-terminal domain-containing pilus assembly protein [Candidatus Competibacteraceae bacterium]|nr:PilX N-terminal domain-containing pilus assembly protein [Candidatus Competibacteraceae bacterium]